MGVLFERFETPLLQEVDYGTRHRSDRDCRHESQVLHQTTGLAFRRFCRTNHAPMSVVELTRLCNLSLAAEWCIAPAQMRQCRRVGVPVEHLRHASFCGHRLLLVSP